MSLNKLNDKSKRKLQLVSLKRYLNYIYFSSDFILLDMNRYYIWDFFLYKWAFKRFSSPCILIVDIIDN